MAGRHDKSTAGQKGRRKDQTSELLFLPGRSEGPGKRSRVQFDLVHAGRRDLSEHLRIGIHEKADPDPPLCATLRKEIQRLQVVGCQNEAALGGPLVSLFGHERHPVRRQCEGQIGHLFREGHFEIDWKGRCFPDAPQIVFIRMTAILPDMEDDLVCSGQPRQMGRGKRVGIELSAGLTKSGDMIDIDTQTNKTAGKRHRYSFSGPRTLRERREIQSCSRATRKRSSELASSIHLSSLSVSTSSPQ